MGPPEKICPGPRKYSRRGPDSCSARRISFESPPPPPPPIIASSYGPDLMSYVLPVITRRLDFVAFPVCLKDNLRSCPKQNSSDQNGIIQFRGNIYFFCTPVKNFFFSPDGWKFIGLCSNLGTFFLHYAWEDFFP
jgi:hypothetical protein